MINDKLLHGYTFQTDIYRYHCIERAITLGLYYQASMDSQRNCLNRNMFNQILQTEVWQMRASDYMVLLHDRFTLDL